MPLERASGMFILDPDSMAKVLFPMTDGAKAVSGLIACDALVEAFGEPGADPLLVFENNRSEIEAIASDKYDAQGSSTDTVELTDDDFEEV